MRPNGPSSGLADALAPLRARRFAVLWGTMVCGNAAGFMRDLANAWTASELSASPVMLALVQAGATLPVFLLAIPAAVLSDTLGRRRMLLIAQILLAAVAALQFERAGAGALNLHSLLVLSLLGGMGAALTGPCWQAIALELAGEPQRRTALALNGCGMAVARTLAPVAGGLLIATAGTAAAYAGILALSLAPLAGLAAWPRKPHLPETNGAHVSGALLAGLRYSRASPPLHSVLWRATLFFGFASAAWALLPWVARRLQPDAAGLYGLLLGFIGLGAIFGALLLPRLRARRSADTLLLAAMLTVAGVLAALAHLRHPLPALALMPLLGASWIIALTMLKAMAQALFPAWVHGRGLAVFLAVLNGAMALGSLAWGLLAEACSVPEALLLAAAGLCAGALWTGRRALPQRKEPF